MHCFLDDSLDGQTLKSQSETLNTQLQLLTKLKLIDLTRVDHIFKYLWQKNHNTKINLQKEPCNNIKE